MTKRGQQQIQYTLSTHAIEKLRPSQTALHLCQRLSQGQLDADAAVTAILKQHSLKRVRTHG